jgi:hypothetical protein
MRKNSDSQQRPRRSTERRIPLTIKMMGQSVKAKLFAAVVLATCVFTIAANAQPRFVGKFTLP